MRRPLLLGHCNYPSFSNGIHSHDRCQGGNTANPDGEFQPCPCPCHLGEEYECGNCGKPLREAPLWPNEDEPGEMVYTHVDPKTGRALGELC